MIADPNANRVIVPPQRITDVPVYSASELAANGDKVAKPKAKTYKLQFQAPPMPGELKVHAYFISDSYLACSVDLPIVVSAMDDSWKDDHSPSPIFYSSKSMRRKKPKQTKTKTISPIQRKTPSPVKWQHSRVKKSSDPLRTVMMIPHRTRMMPMTTMMETSRAIPMGKRRSGGRWPMIRAIRIAINGSCPGERAFAY